MDYLMGVSQQLIIAAIGAVIGVIGKFVLDSIIKRRRNRAIAAILNFPEGEIELVHSALFDNTRSSYNFPSCDMVAIRRITNLLESIDLKEGIDFNISPESRWLTETGNVDPEVYTRNLILFGGSKRNKITAHILDKSADYRYKMKLSDSGENYMYDSVINHDFISSRDNPAHSLQSHHHDPQIGHDYGLILSTSNPLNRERRIIILAGLHGPGTIGAATFFSDLNHHNELESRRSGGVLEAVVYCNYRVESDRILNVSLV